MEVNVQSAGLRAVLCAITVAIALAACGGDEPSAPSADPAAAGQSSKAPAAATTQGMVRGVTDESKPGAPVDLRFQLKARPARGEALPIEIAFVPREPSELLRATFVGTEGLTIAPSPVPAEYKNVEAEGIYRHTLTVTPREDGVFYISAYVVMNMTNGAEVRTFHIPVLVGTPRENSGTAQPRPAAASPATGS